MEIDAFIGELIENARRTQKASGYIVDLIVQVLKKQENTNRCGNLGMMT